MNISDEYKCDIHELDFVCRGCVKAWINRHDRMKAFIKTLADIPNDDMRSISVQSSMLLKEIGL